MCGININFFCYLFIVLLSGPDGKEIYRSCQEGCMSIFVSSINSDKNPTRKYWSKIITNYSRSLETSVLSNQNCLSRGHEFLPHPFHSVFCQNDYDTELDNFENGIMLRDSMKNNTKFGCVWRPMNNPCPDRDINFYYYAGYSGKQRKKKINPNKKSSLSETSWDPHKHNIVYIHGYGGGDGTFPNYIVRDAYVRNGSYNVFIVDWSPLARIPCYTAAVHNLNPVAKCTANFYKNLRSQGVPTNRITCIGHSLGAHGCGLVSNYVNFRMHRIVGLDPAGPMIPSSSRLRSGMADSVQVMHTNAGTFGDSTSSGRVNFCMNGGKSQPPCDGASLGSDLCSHIVAVCYWAESIDGSTARKAYPCTRQCPYGPRKISRSGFPIMMGEHTPDKATGSFCVNSNDPPYCPKNGNPNGHPWCCLGRRGTKQAKEFGKLWNKNKPK